MVKDAKNPLKLLKLTLRNKWTLVVILLLVAVSRFLLLYEGVIPFAFDHGKDALAVLEMGVALKPYFIGPWTSIPGLYFGPGWYYLLLPGAILSGFNPMASVATMVILHLIQIVLAYKFLNKWTAIIIALAPFWFTVSTSAWNPFPMTLISLLLLILLKRVARGREISTKIAFLIGLVASLGFHFSSAYAVFYPAIVLLWLYIVKSKIKIKSLLAAAVGFVIPFAPQIIFELRHGFVQTKAVTQYFANPKAPGVVEYSTKEVLLTTLGELKSGLLPDFRGFDQIFSKIAQVVLVVGLVYGLISRKILDDKKIRSNMLLASLFILIPLVGYNFLHFNVWYVYGMLPIIAYIFSLLLEKTSKYFQLLWAGCLVIGLVSAVWFFHSENKFELMANRGFLPIKKQVVDEVRSRAGDRPFAVYHYAPDIYDFGYQYIYLTQALSGAELPTEFSYEPNAVEYVVQKNNLMQKIAVKKPEAMKNQGKSPELIFYVVEAPEHDVLLDQWWDKQHYSEIVEEIEMSSSVRLFVANP